MVSVIVYRICIHVSNTEDVDEHTEEGCNKQKHNSDVVDVNSNAEDFLLNGHTICANPSKAEPVTNVVRPCSTSNKFDNENQ